jgi:hypothetical protein
MTDINICDIKPPGVIRIRGNQEPSGHAAARAGPAHYAKNTGISAYRFAVKRLDDDSALIFSDTGACLPSWIPAHANKPAIASGVKRWKHMQSIVVELQKVWRSPAPMVRATRERLPHGPLGAAAGGFGRRRS